MALGGTGTRDIEPFRLTVSATRRSATVLNRASRAGCRSLGLQSLASARNTVGSPPTRPLQDLSRNGAHGLDTLR